MLGKLQSVWTRHVGNGGGDFGGPPPPDEPIGLLGRIERSGHRREWIGAGVGAAVGGVAGYFHGLSGLQQDSVTIQTQAENVTRPVVVGARFVPEFCSSQYGFEGDGSITDLNQSCQPAHVQPILERQPTGATVVNRSLAHTQNWTNPLGSAAIGLASGAAIGFAGAVLYNLIRGPEAEEEGPSQGSGNSPWIGAAIGGVVGATGGYLAGQLAESKQIHLDQTRQTAVFQPRQIGWIPRTEDFPHLRGGSNEIYYKDLNVRDVPFRGHQPVTEPVPTGEIRESAEHSQAYGLNRVTGTLVGLGLGATVGVAAGIAGGLVQRGLERS